MCEQQHHQHHCTHQSHATAFHQCHYSRSTVLTESSLPNRRCSSSLQANSPHMNFTPHTRSSNPFLAQLFRMIRTRGYAHQGPGCTLYSTTAIASSSCRTSASTSHLLCSRFHRLT
jgi:hypothetical protein